MQKGTIHALAIGLALLLFVINFVFVVLGHAAQLGIPMVVVFLLLAVGFGGYKKLKGYVFTALLLAGVLLALYYPGYFVSVGDFEFTALIIPLIQVIMLGMGVSMSVDDFAEVFKTPRSVFIGVSAQLGIMPVIGFLLAKFSGFPPEVAAGLVLVGASPSGVASNVIAYLSKANVALSVTITSVATLIAPFVTPLLMEFFAGEFVHIDIVAMMWAIIKMILVPVGAGLVVNRILREKVKIINKIMPIVSMVSIGVIIVVIVSKGRDSLLEIGGLLLVLVLIHNISGYLLGYWYARIFKLSEQDARTIAIEVGMQNGGLASGIANSIGKIATMGLAPAVFGPLMNISGSILASYWQNKPLKNDR